MNQSRSLTAVPWKYVLLITALVVLVASLSATLLMQSRTTLEPTQKKYISPTNTLTLDFSETMDRASVETKADIRGIQVRSTSWNGNAWTIVPQKTLEVGETIEIVVPANTLMANGQSLGIDQVFAFVVSPAPSLAAILPSPGSVGVPVDAEITIVFDRPMVPLTQVQGALSKVLFSDASVSITPAVSGAWRWMGTSTATFRPSKPLLRATKYSVSVPAGIRTLSGDRIEAETQWSFETERPRVLSITPESGSKSAGPTTTVSIRFNQPVQRAKLAEYIRLFDGTVSESTLTSSSKTGSGVLVPVKKFRYGTMKENATVKEDRTVIELDLATPLAFGRTYSLYILAGLPGEEGNLGTAEMVSSSFSTVGDFKVLSANLIHGNLQVVFSSPVSAEQVKSGLQFSPTISLKDIEASTYASYQNDSHNNLDLYLNFAPSTTYTMTTSSKFSDIYGQKLAKPFTYKFTTEPREPDFFIHPRSHSFSIFERGKTPTYFLNGLNISSFNVKIAELDMQAFNRLVQGKGFIEYYNNNSIDLHDFASTVREFSLKSRAKKNVWESRSFDLEKHLGTLKPGVYAITLKSPEKSTQDRRVFAVTNLGATLKYSGKKALVWVVDIVTGRPVPGATVTFRSNDGSVATSGSTDAKGFYETTINLEKLASRYQPNFYVTVEKGDDFTFVGSNWNNGFQPYDFDGVSQDFRYIGSDDYRVHSFLYTDRPLYRAGDTVHFKGIIRLLDWDGKFTVPQRSRYTVDVRVTDAQQNEIYRKTLPLSDFGTFNAEVPVAKEAPLGTYSIQATLLPEPNSYSYRLYGSFSVLAYRKPEYKVDVAPEKTDYKNGETFSATVSGQYYFGAPMQKATVQWRARLQDYFFNKYTESWYSFSEGYGDCWYWNCRREESLLTSGEGTLDGNGHLDISFPLKIDEKKVSQGMALEVDITDKNNQVVSGHASVLVHKSDVYVGVRSDSFGVQAGEKATLNVITLTKDGLPAPNVRTIVTLLSRTYNVIREKGVDGEYYYTNKSEDTKLSSSAVVTDERGKAETEVTLPQGGEFVVVVTAQDDAKRESKASWSLYAWSNDYYNWPRSNNDRMPLVADKPLYKPGETAKIIIKSPYQGESVQALVTVERENVISKQVITITKNAQAIEVPITSDMIPTAYVSVTIVKPRIGETFNEFGLDTGAPAFKIGYAKLKIDTEEKRVTMKIITDKKRYLPREKVAVRIETVDARGNPVPTEVSLAVVDRSLLDLVAFKNPDLIDYFYHERGLGVMTSNMLAYLMERFKPGSKGGGGGGEEGDENSTRSNLVDTAYWNPSIVTDKNGIASVAFTLPENLTTWHLLALGSTKAHQFAVESSEIIETKHVILRLVRPRFAVRGDRMVLGAIVHNYLPSKKTFTVSLKGKGFKQNGPASHEVTIEPDGNTKVLFPVTIDEGAGSATFNFSATTEGGSDAIEEVIPVYEFGIPQANATSGMTEDSVSETVRVPTKADASAGKLSVKVAPSLAVNLPASLEFLSQYPYGCSEQTMSALIPNIALKQLQGFEQFAYVDENTLDKRVSIGLQKLLAFQHYDGGFGYWESKSNQTSFPYLTAYIVYGLRIAKDAGYHVDQTMLDRALTYLQTQSRGLGKNASTLSGPVRVYILYVLSEFGQTDASLLLSEAKKRQELPIVSKAYLSMALKAAKQDAKAKEILNEILSSSVQSDRLIRFHDAKANAYYETMNTDDNTNAIIARMFLRVDASHVLLPKIIRGLLSMRHNGHWDTTQSTAQSVLTLVEYLKRTKELDYDFTSTIRVDKKNVKSYTMKGPELLSYEITTALEQLPRGEDLAIDLEKKGTGRLYYDILLSYFYTPKTLPPVDEGIGITRETTPLSDADSAMKVGTTHKVRLTITVPASRYFVAVESMLPAGFEPIDLQYATSQQNLLENVANPPQKSWDDYYRNQTWRFSHIEYRDDRVFLFAEELPPGVYRYEYLVRATTPGTFRERPARAWEMYYPETFGQTNGGPMTISE